MKDKLIYPKNMLNLSRSKWKMPHRHKTTFMHGDLFVADSFEVLPGDTIKLDIASLIRMSTPIAPIMDNIEMHYAAYFVPMRLIFENWEELCGANKDGAWTTGMDEVVVPHIAAGTTIEATKDGGDVAQNSFTVSNSAFSAARWKYMTLRDYFIGHLTYANVDINILRFRAYYDIWNEHYRSQVVSAPIAIDKSNNNAIIVGEAAAKTILRKPEPVGKFPDYFTKALPEPQKGPDVEYLKDIMLGALPLGDSYLITDAKIDATFDAYGSDDSEVVPTSNGVLSDSDFNFVTNLYAKASTSTMRTINDLRYAFQLQKFLEKDARFGTRYFEYLNAHYGVTIADSVAQRPQFLGEINYRLNIDQVLSTAGAASDTTTKLGQPGANSVTGGKGQLFTFSSVEHGYIIIVGAARHEHTYCNTIDKSWLHINKLDFYHPEFANIGEQGVLTNELDCNYADSQVGEAGFIFGYQEAWAEYRFIPDRVSALLSPANTGALSFWTLADPARSEGGYTLEESFIYEDRSSISRCLVTGQNGPDYIADIYFDLTIARVMPVYSIPGFADHH